MGTPQQGHYSSLEEVAHKLVLLEDRSAGWAYAFIWLNEALSHAPLSSEGHVSSMMDGVPSREACSHLHQLQVCKLLQHKDLVVCLEGLNGEMEASWFTFQELPLLDTAAPGEPAHELQLIEVDLGGMQSERITTAIQTHQSTPILPPPASLLGLPATSLQ